MKKLFVYSVILISLFYIFKIYRDEREKRKKGKKIEILIVKDFFEKDEGIENAYTSILEEEGIPFKWISPAYLLSNNLEDIIKYNPSIIFPDKLSRILTDEIGQWCAEYVKKGGSIIAVFDSGVYNKNKRYRKTPVFSNIFRVNYAPYEKYRKNLYFNGNLKFTGKKEADFFEIPYGRLIDGFFISGYKYGKLTYPFFKCENPERFTKIYAYGIDKKERKYPAIIEINEGKGKAIYVNLPLGYLKAYGSEDMLPRTILRTFLFKFTSIPHLVNTPYGKGGIVINWHIDNKEEWKAIPGLIKKHKVIRKSLRYSFHITAGDFVDKPGDGKGFDAEGEGKKYVKLMSKYGIIGSHGGWANGWFAKHLKDGKLNKEEIEYYIMKNTEVLEKIVGYKIIEYAVPNRVHPQPLLIKILEKNGFICYYYPMDIGSAPNRTFYNGKMVSNKVIAFPMMPNGKYASLAEMGRSKLSPAEVKKWLFSISDYIVKNRTVRLYYTNPYQLLDYPQYISPLRSFINHLEGLKNKGEITVEPMSYFAKFLLIFLKTNYSFTKRGNDIKISIKNDKGLEGICIAVPKKYKIIDKDGLKIEEDKRFKYLVITEKTKEKTIPVEVSKYEN